MGVPPTTSDILHRFSIRPKFYFLRGQAEPTLPDSLKRLATARFLCRRLFAVRRTPLICDLAKRLFSGGGRADAAQRRFLKPCGPFQLLSSSEAIIGKLEKLMLPVRPLATT